MFVHGSDYREQTEHVKFAIALGHSSSLRRRADEASRAWLNDFKKPGKVCHDTSGQKDCDEYPYASTLEGGPGASLRLIAACQNRGCGARLGWFYRICNVPMGAAAESFLVLPLIESPISGGICN